MAARGQGLVQVRIGRGLQVEPVGALRNERGQYTSGGVNAQLDANRTLALYLQAQVVDRMKEHISGGHRAAASTGRLVNATAHPRNAVFTKEFVGVGLPEWLDRSEAKYWRTFEEGSAAVWSHPFVGTTLFGMKGASYPSAHGQRPGIRTLRPDRLEALLSGGDDDEDGPGRKSSGTMFVVQHEIQPANIYAQVAQENRGQIGPISVQYARRVMQEAVKEIVVAGPPPGAPSASFYWR